MTLHLGVLPERRPTPVNAAPYTPGPPHVFLTFIANSAYSVAFLD